MIKYLFILCLLFFIAVISSCKTDRQKETDTVRHIETGYALADTIIYPVDVINLDSTDSWADTRLKRLQREELTDLFFEALYNGDAKALDYYSREKIPVSELKKMEASGELNRDEMAQLQFEESWYFNPEEATMTKEVHSILLAWPVYDNQGVFQAYKAGFVLELNP